MRGRYLTSIPREQLSSQGRFGLGMVEKGHHRSLE
jgi:hypothetical protein